MGYGIQSPLTGLIDYVMLNQYFTLAIDSMPKNGLKIIRVERTIF